MKTRVQKVIDEPPFRSIRVSILGRPYPLRVRPENEATIRRIAEYVDGRMQSVKRRLPDRPDLTVAVIAALSVAEELFTSLKRSNEDPRTVASDLEELVRQLDSALGDDGS